MKISIIGANSYIARNFIYYLNKNSSDNLFLYDLHEEQKDRISQYQKINVLDKEDVKKINFDVDLIYLFVGKTGTSQGFANYDEYIAINEIGLLNVLNAYVETKSIAKIIFPSTRLVYKGKPGKLTESSEKEFKTIYAINKYACEKYLEMYHNYYNVNYVVFRICVPYGSLIHGVSSYGTAEFMLNNAKEGKDINLYGGGIVRRTLIHIEDLCRALYLGAIDENTTNNIFNIGGENYSLKEMADLIAGVYKIKVNSTPWPQDALKIESNDTVFDSNKFDKLLDFEYIHNFKDWIDGQSVE